MKDTHSYQIFKFNPLLASYPIFWGKPIMTEQQFSGIPGNYFYMSTETIKQ